MLSRYLRRSNTEEERHVVLCTVLKKLWSACKDGKHFTDVVKLVIFKGGCGVASDRGYYGPYIRGVVTVELLADI